MADVNFVKRLDAPPKAKTQIYALAPPGASAKALTAFAKELGVASARAEHGQDPVALTYAAGQHVLTLYKASGAIRYQDRTRWQVDDGEANVKLTDEEATRLALALVSKHGLARPPECELLRVTRLTVGELNAESKRGSERVIDVAVAFRRLVDRVPVDGPGGKLVVYLDQQGELTGFDRIWRPIRAPQAPVRELRPPKLAEADLVRSWRAHAGRIDVTDMRFGYFELGYQDAQRILQPAYVMLLTLVAPDQRMTMKTAHVFAAAANAVGRLMPPPKKAVPQPARR
jgi:hypothetical protein